MREYSDPATTIQIQAGDRFSIVLESQAGSSGFTWKAAYDSAFLKEVKPKAYIPRSEMIGAAAEERFEFEAVKPGETTIAMTYQREWKTVSQDSRTFKVSISNA